VSAVPVEHVAPAPRLLAGIHRARPVTLAEHLSRHGRLDPRPRRSLHAVLDASGLEGRGGAAFPVARKLAAVAARRGRPVVVVNATEGEPLSGKDKVLLRHVPHLVLDGAVALASELGTNDVVVAIASAAKPEAAAVAAAIAERSSRRIDGRVRIEMVAVPDRFVAGEETALVHFLNGGPAVPTMIPPRPFERGVGGRPTLVQNAETVAYVALLARHGAGWFRRLGTQSEPGPALFTVSGAVRRPGVHEVALGIPLLELVELAGGPSAVPQAVLVGGYFGTWFTAAAARELTLDDACLASRGGGLGARVVFVLAAEQCGVAETARVARFLAEQSAGQCGPCVHGLAAIAGALARTARLERVDERARIARWCGQVEGRGACRHPDGAVRFVASALDVFSAEFDAHCTHGRCTRAR
jgi:NADH:ubiquinone oxidoreductase subunit F (NADH-binding)